MHKQRVEQNDTISVNQNGNRSEVVSGYLLWYVVDFSQIITYQDSVFLLTSH